MQTEYSAGAVTAARSLQTFTVSSAATFWTYDYTCSLHQELTFLLRSHWTKKCQMLNNICSCFSFISIICSECFFIIRTYTLWNNNKIVLGGMLIAFLVSPMPTLHPTL
ncbi:hypothetical protein DFH29DRAFT_924602 [Suillus ampliporus]|nr:hypothetical protein DFH29DRAFT_924602 [Suillus ampliporus]